MNNSIHIHKIELPQGFDVEFDLESGTAKVKASPVVNRASELIIIDLSAIQKRHYEKIAELLMFAAREKAVVTKIVIADDEPRAPRMYDLEHGVSVDWPRCNVALAGERRPQLNRCILPRYHYGKHMNPVEYRW